MGLYNVDLLTKKLALSIFFFENFMADIKRLGFVVLIKRINFSYFRYRNEIINEVSGYYTSKSIPIIII